MKSFKILVFLLIVGVVHSATRRDVPPEQTVDEAIEEADNEDAEITAPSEDDSPIPPPEEEDPPADENPEITPYEAGEDEEEQIKDVLQPEEGETVPTLPEPAYSLDGQILFFPRIIGGQRAFLGEFPSKVSLQNRAGEHFCGGNLITNNHVLTAAHCVVHEDGILRPGDIEIMAGDISITKDAGPNRVHRFVSHVFAHPEYNMDTMEHDITVLRVGIPFTSVEGLLMPEAVALIVPPAGTTCHLAGWGAIQEDKQTASPYLMRVNLEIVEFRKCDQSYKGLVREKMFCAGTMKGGRDACQGDSGGGLMCNGQITGIVSFGYGCGRPRFPGVYLDVTQYRDFINEALSFDGDQDQIPTPRVPGAASGLQKMSGAVVVAVGVVLYGMF